MGWSHVCHLFTFTLCHSHPRHVCHLLSPDVIRRGQRLKELLSAYDSVDTPTFTGGGLAVGKVPPSKTAQNNTALQLGLGLGAREACQGPFTRTASPPGLPLLCRTGASLQGRQARHVCASHKESCDSQQRVGGQRGSHDWWRCRCQVSLGDVSQK